MFLLYSSWTETIDFWIIQSYLSKPNISLEFLLVFTVFSSIVFVMYLPDISSTTNHGANSTWQVIFFKNRSQNPKKGKWHWTLTTISKYISTNLTMCYIWFPHWSCLLNIISSTSSHQFLYGTNIDIKINNTC